MTALRTEPLTASPAPRRRVRLQLEGLVQGVGFRPFVDRLARDLGLAGWVANSGNGVTLEVEGAASAIEDFLERLTGDLPPLARVDRMRREVLAPVGDATFIIRESLSGSSRSALILPDAATCDDCLSEILDPSDRRYRYPFTNCTNCGPRLSILEDLPYDRSNTTMRRFTMCPACRAEYETPADRRLHAQPNACPDCGPQLALWDPAGTVLAERHQALLAAAEALRDGRIVALKGLGGFQLLADARDEEAVAVLRRRKARPDKPFAVMAPSLRDAEALCLVSDQERALLTAPQAPIVLLHRRARPGDGHARLAPSVAPGNPLLGIMLPYTPLHHLLMRDLAFPIVATSGNLSDEPMVTDERDALDRLSGIADLFLVHDRPIACPLDDSVIRVAAGRALMLRRARGYAPLALPTPTDQRRRPAPLLALGGHLKAAAAMTLGDRVILGPHIGDLGTARARQAFDGALDHLRGLHAARPAALACDRHPDYYTTRLARQSATRVIPVQHHVAHIAACMAENGLDGPVLGVAWDGTGYGEDGTIWGGEFIVIDGTRERRAAHLAEFPLPGGDAAAREPRRAAIGLLYALFGKAALDDEALAPVRSFAPAERKVLGRMLARGLNAPLCSSAGRLFDAAAALMGLVQRASFEGQAAMAVEFAARGGPAPPYPIGIAHPAGGDDGPLVLDWRPMIQALLADIKRGASIPHMASAFHYGLVEAIAAAARQIGEARLVLTGGCFQNACLLEAAVAALRRAGLSPYWHRHVPPNDGGLAFGQAVWAARLLAEEPA